MTSTASPKAKPAPTSATRRLTPSEIASLREHKKTVVSGVQGLLAQEKADRKAQAAAMDQATEELAQRAAGAKAAA